MGLTTLSIVLGYNRSVTDQNMKVNFLFYFITFFLNIILKNPQTDTTYGWHGEMAGFTLMYSHLTDVLIEQSNNFPLSPGLIPIAR